MYEHKPFKKGFFSEYTVFGVFIAVAAFGLIFGGVLAMMGGEWGDGTVQIVEVENEELVLPPEPVTAPGKDEYRLAARSAVFPFLLKLQNVPRDGEWKNTDYGLRQAAIDTQAGLLKITVPVEERDEHLALVLLFDQWKRAVDGSASDRRAVIKKLDAMLATGGFDWLQQ